MSLRLVKSELRKVFEFCVAYCAMEASLLLLDFLLSLVTIGLVPNKISLQHVLAVALGAGVLVRQLLVVCQLVPAVIALLAPLALMRLGRLAITVPCFQVLGQVLLGFEATPSAKMARDEFTSSGSSRLVRIE